MVTDYNPFKNHAHITIIYIHNTDQNMRFDLFFPPGKYSLTTVYEELRKRVIEERKEVKTGNKCFVMADL